MIALRSMIVEAGGVAAGGAEGGPPWGWAADSPGLFAWEPAAGGPCLPGGQAVGLLR
jgi:hypothetical protein